MRAAYRAWILNREANSRLLSLKFNVEGCDMGSVIDEARAIVEPEIEVPEGHFLVWGGSSRTRSALSAGARSPCSW